MTTSPAKRARVASPPSLLLPNHCTTDLLFFPSPPVCAQSALTSALTEARACYTAMPFPPQLPAPLLSASCVTSAGAAPADVAPPDFAPADAAPNTRSVLDELDEALDLALAPCAPQPIEPADLDPFVLPIELELEFALEAARAEHRAQHSALDAVLTTAATRNSDTASASSERSHSNAKTRLRMRHAEESTVPVIERLRLLGRPDSISVTSAPVRNGRVSKRRSRA
eukprot:IDg14754t1